MIEIEMKMNEVYYNIEVIKNSQSLLDNYEKEIAKQSLLSIELCS
jgi:hypothetical protein